MKLLITGGTGFIGTPLCRVLTQRGHELLILSRHPAQTPPMTGATYCSWDSPSWPQAAQGCEGVINLAGEPLAASRWSPQRKSLIRESRLAITRRLVEGMARWPAKPAVF